MDDAKEKGIRTHAFNALLDFSTQLEAAQRAVAGGWLYEDASRRLIAAASSALPFLDRDIREGLESVVRLADGLRAAHEKGLVTDYTERSAVDAVAVLIVEATLGVPDKKLEETPAPAPAPTSTDDTIPF